MLYGEKVLLRPITEFDLERLLEFANDVEITLAGGGDPPTPKDEEEIRETFLGARDGLGAKKVDFAIVADGECVGSCGLYEIHDSNRTCELGISIGDKGYWDKGYGTQAVDLLLDYAFRFRNFRRVWLEVHAANHRAIKCYARCGFTDEGRRRKHAWLAGEYVDLVMMGLLREEWKKDNEDTDPGDQRS
ncbi:MAG: GNAT family N-acetyltransferase [Rubrobacter sp.]